MKLNQYQTDCLRTWRRDRPYYAQRINAALGLAGEAGEVADLIKKVEFHGHTLDVADVTEELGDVLYYVAAMAHAFGLKLEDIAEVNIEKLKKRYPDGFSVERSVNRDD